MAARQQADASLQFKKPINGLYIALVILIWLLLALVVGLVVWNLAHTGA